MKLSERLAALVPHLPNGCPLADIGTDHAYLPIYAVREGVAKRAVAGEVIEGPFRSARANVEKYQMEEKIDIRLGNGLSILAPSDEIDCVVISGMGGILISRILEEGKGRLKGVRRLILQPNNGAELVRLWLMEHGWQLMDETMVEEDGYIYEILVAEPARGKPVRYSEKELLFGPFLLDRRPPAFEKKWKQELEKWKRILTNLEYGKKTAEVMKKTNQLKSYINMYREVFRNESGEG